MAVWVRIPRLSRRRFSRRGRRSPSPGLPPTSPRCRGTDSSSRPRAPAPASRRRSPRRGSGGFSTALFLRLRRNGYALGPTNPERTILPPEPCGFRRAGFSPAFALLIPAFALPGGPRPLPRPLRPPGDAPLPRPAARRRPTCRRFGGPLSPVHSWRRAPGPVSYYALLQGWLLLSQPPGCLRGATTLSTQRPLRDLTGRSGLLPSRPWSLAPTV